MLSGLWKHGIRLATAFSQEPWRHALELNVLCWNLDSKHRRKEGTYIEYIVKYHVTYKISFEISYKISFEISYEIWWNMMKYHMKSWWNMMKYDEIWWTMMNYDELWWNMMKYDEIWMFFFQSVEQMVDLIWNLLEINIHRRSAVRLQSRCPDQGSKRIRAFR